MAEDSSEAEEEEKDPPCEECKPGAPLWMATFADMATLLMAFFVLLLSFADTKVDKYKKVVGSLSNAFGMPTPRVMVKGTSLIEQEFSPSIAQQSVVNTPSQRSKDTTKSELELKQETDEKDSDIKSELKRLQKVLETEIAEGQVNVKIDQGRLVVELKGKSAGGGKNESPSEAKQRIDSAVQKKIDLYAKIATAQQELSSNIEVRDNSLNESLSNPNNQNGKDKQRSEGAIEKKIAELELELEGQIAAGFAEIERKGNQVIVRLGEKGAFSSGGAEIDPMGVVALRAVSEVMLKNKGKVTIAGHTDDTPILHHPKYRTNFDLSAARAAAVADSLSALLDVPRKRIDIKGYADTRPLVPNTSQKNREKNRRIEIIMDTNNPS